MGESKKCIKCKLDVLEDKSSFKCDGCNRFLHVQCANVTATEIKCLQLQSRRMKFFCEECEEGLLQIPVLKQMIEALQREVEELKNRNPDRLLENETIVNEVFERQKRAKNVILYNLPESDLPDSLQRKENDKEQAHEIFKNILDTPLQIVNVVRLGKKKDKVRPVKVILHNAEDALMILKGKNLLGNSRVRIASDQTQRQQEIYKALKAQLENRKAKGEQDIFIKYIRGVPKIISKVN